MRWAAPEVLEDGIFSLKSDAWSFAILLWEIWAFGEKPYNSLKLNKEVRRQILAGLRLPMPDGCPPEIYNMMMNCWDYVSFGCILNRALIPLFVLLLSCDLLLFLIL